MSNSPGENGCTDLNEVRIHIDDDKTQIQLADSGKGNNHVSDTRTELGKMNAGNDKDNGNDNDSINVKELLSPTKVAKSSICPVTAAGLVSRAITAPMLLLSPVGSAGGKVSFSPVHTVGGGGVVAAGSSTGDGTFSDWEQSLRHPSTGKNLMVSVFKSPKNTLIQVIRAGMAKAQLTWWQTLLLGVMAGGYIAMGGALAVTIAGMLGNTDVAYRSALQRLALAGLFPVGLFIIIIAGGELFTGNVMYLSSALIAKKIGWKDVARNWVLSYFGNYAGCVAFAFLFICSTTTGLETPTANATFVSNLLVSKTSEGWGAVLLRAVACNWLVCLAVWMAACAEDVSGKLIAVWWPIMTFVAIGFEHSIANMFYLMLGLMEGGANGSVTFGNTLAWNLIPVTIGNIIGGLFFIGMQILLFGPYFSAEFLEIKSGQKKTNAPTAMTNASKTNNNSNATIAASTGPSIVELPPTATI